MTSVKCLEVNGVAGELLQTCARHVSFYMLIISQTDIFHSSFNGLPNSDVF